MRPQPFDWSAVLVIDPQHQYAFSLFGDAIGWEICPTLDLTFNLTVFDSGDAVPDPATGALILVGLGTLQRVRRRTGRLA